MRGFLLILVCRSPRKLQNQVQQKKKKRKSFFWSLSHPSFSLHICSFISVFLLLPVLSFCLDQLSSQTSSYSNGLTFDHILVSIISLFHPCISYFAITKLTCSGWTVAGSLMWSKQTCRWVSVAQTRTSGDAGALRHMMIVARVVWAAFSCIDTVVVILSDCCDTVEWAERKKWKVVHVT